MVKSFQICISESMSVNCAIDVHVTGTCVHVIYTNRPTFFT